MPMKRIVLLLLSLSYASATLGQVGDIVFRDGFEVVTQISISPTLSFPPQLVASSSAPLTVTITNVGTATLAISEIGSSGANASDFVVDLSGTQFTLAPTSSTTLNVTFAPAAPWQPGTRQGLLNVLGNVSGGAVYSAESGMGVTCAGPVPAAQSGGLCADTDLDGLNDAWEDNGYIDLNNDGAPDAGDFFFPHQTPYVFSAISHSGTGTGQLFPTVTDPTTPVATSTVVVTIGSTGGIGVATFSYAVNGGPDSSPALVLPVVDIGANVRLMFYGSFNAAGDAYTFTTAMGSDAAVVDKNIPNIFVQYDYMGWDAPGNACATDSECVQGGSYPNDVCYNGFCNHNHAPGDPLFRKVVDAFAAHNIRLYIDPVHQAVPHAQVITWNQWRDGTTGATAACAGYDVVKGNISTGGAVNFHDVKNRPGSAFALDPFRKNLFHYAVFSHFATCLQEGPGPGDCGQCPDDRATPSGKPPPGIAGTSELPGNDFIVSMAARWYVADIARTPFDEQGPFMHELGHNLGLHHDGDNANVDSVPNYLSVMNNKYIFSGIQHAATPGSAVSVESLREVDYSEHTLNTLVENHLDEQAGVSSASSNFTGIVRFFNFAGGNGSGPESGPINWDGQPDVACSDPSQCVGSSLTGICLGSGFCEVQADLNKDGVLSETMIGYRDWDHSAGQSGANGGACVTSADCRINAVRQKIQTTIDPTIDPHEPCLNGTCQSLWLNFQGTPWGKADAESGAAAPVVFDVGDPTIPPARTSPRH
jgi:hypothetical protein